MDLNERLKQATGRDLNQPVADAIIVASWHLGARWPKLSELDDTMAYIARYLRVPWEYLETRSLPRLLEMQAACNRIVAAENGKRSPLDLSGGSEDNR